MEWLYRIIFVLEKFRLPTAAKRIIYYVECDETFHPHEVIWLSWYLVARGLISRLVLTLNSLQRVQEI